MTLAGKLLIGVLCVSQMETTAIRLMRPIKAMVQRFAVSTILREGDAHGSVLQEMGLGFGIEIFEKF